jgi:hypothetical protein
MPPRKRKNSEEAEMEMKEGSVTMTLPELIKEHTRLVKSLKKGKLDEKEVKIQTIELEKYKKMKKTEK